MDETSYSVNGKLYWVWTILNPQNEETYYAVRNSRGADVLKELLPEWNGTVICDGWSPYGIFEKMQRCWAHIIREARHMSEKNPDDRDARRVLESLRDMNDNGKKKRPAKDRQKAHDLLALRIKRMISRHVDNPLLGKFMIKLKMPLPHMFTFVLNPHVPSTNNTAERSLHEIVVHRKIRGGLKSENTPNTMGNIFTCFMTWKAQGFNHLE